MNRKSENASAVFARYLDDVSDRRYAIARKLLSQFMRQLGGFLLNGLDSLKFSTLIIGNEGAVNEQVEKVAHQGSVRRV